MIDEIAQAKLREWLGARPAKVQALAEEFPIGHEIEIDNGETLYVIGWNEDDRLIVSATPLEEMLVSPEAYEKAMAARQYICAQHLRDERKKDA